MNCAWLINKSARITRIPASGDVINIPIDSELCTVLCRYKIDWSIVNAQKEMVDLFGKWMVCKYQLSCATCHNQFRMHSFGEKKIIIKKYEVVQHYIWREFVTYGVITTRLVTNIPGAIFPNHQLLSHMRLMHLKNYIWKVTRKSVKIFKIGY